MFGDASRGMSNSTNAFTVSRIFSASFRLFVARLKKVRTSAESMREASTAALNASFGNGRHRQRAGLSTVHRFATTSYLVQ